MLKEYRRCRNGQRNNLFRWARAHDRELLKHGDFEALPVKESMRGHQHRLDVGYCDVARIWRRSQSFDGVKRLVRKYVGRPFRELEDRVIKLYPIHERDHIMGNLRFSLGFDAWRCSYVEFNVDEHGIIQANPNWSRRRRQRDRVEIKPFVIPFIQDKVSKAFVKFDGSWYKVELGSASSSQVPYFDSWDLEFKGRYWTRWHNDAFGFSMGHHSFLSIDSNDGRGDSTLKNRYAIKRHSCSSTELRWIESYLETGSFKKTNVSFEGHEFCRSRRNS